MTRRVVIMTAVLFAAPALPQTMPCLRNDGQCPLIGCAQPGTSEAEANLARNTHVARNARLYSLSIDDFEELQLAANRIGLQGFAIAVGERRRYEKLLAAGRSNEKIGDGARVEFTGFIVGTPHARRTDSANCRAVGRENNSFRFHLAALPDDTEFDAILAELIPRGRHQLWTLERLRRIAQLRKPVRVTGKLFYDSKHFVNSDPTNELQGSPRRLSLWEIHPVSEFWVCKACSLRDCERPDQWIELEKMPEVTAERQDVCQ